METIGTNHFIKPYHGTMSGIMSHYYNVINNSTAYFQDSDQNVWIFDKNVPCYLMKAKVVTH